ncbi:MAG: MG2 domain-containing protein, partial [Isosphaeraceae bacterium]
MRRPSRSTCLRQAAWPALLASAALVIGPEFATAEGPGENREARVISAKTVITPAAPVLPATTVAALQEGRYDVAESELTAWEAKSTDASEKAYAAWIKGIAQRLDGRPDAARATLKQALDSAPQGRWSAKIRAELAAVELAAGRASEAEALARAEAESLLSGGRKDQLAEVYQNFARRLLKPDDPVTPADPKAAYELLAQARSLAKGSAIRASLLFEMARAARQSGDHAKAILDFQNYLKEFPQGVDRIEARYLLGESQRESGQALPARLTWTDLARDLQGKEGDAKAAADFRAKALYGIALTHGVPTPPNDTSLNLGIAALERYLEAYPAHPLAVKAAYQIGASALARGKSERALSAFGRFLGDEGFRAESDEAKRDLAELTMTATYQVGEILQGQRKFDEAIAAWRGYLAKFPNGPQSAAAQSAIVGARLLIAEDHLAQERYDEARAAWQAFVSQNPLDSRVPDLLFKVGESFQTEKKHDRAIAAWEPLLSKFPDSEPAAHAQFQIAAIHETEKGDPEGAIERFRKIAVEPWRSRGAQRVAVMESRVLRVVTPRTFRSGETPHLKVTTRNLESLTFSAYKLDAESYFRKKHEMDGVEALDIGLVAPDAEWTVPVPKYARFKPIETTYDLDKLKVPGVHVVKVTDEKHLQATTLVIGSDVDAIVKSSNEHLLVFAQDMKTGKGRPNARVLVAQDGKVILETKTGADGVSIQKWETPRALGTSFDFLVIDGPHVAGNVAEISETLARGLSPRAYLYTDRPAYRPGQQVALRGVVREIHDGQYAVSPKAVYKLEVTDARGRQIVARDVALSEFGTFHQTLPLDAGAPIGTYRVRLHQPGKSEFTGTFEVQSYRLEAIDLSFELPKTVYFRGETVSADLVARYQYGAPAGGRPIAVGLPDGQVVRGETDAAGKFHVEFPTVGFAEEQTLGLIAQLTQDNVAASANVALVVRAFSIAIETTRDTYLSGESFLVTTTTRDFLGEPIGQSLNVALLKQETRANRTTEREVSRKSIATEPKTGVAKLSMKADDAEGGTYLVRVSGTDRFGNPVVEDLALEISGEKGETQLLLLSDRQSYKVGEEASVNLHSRGASGTALLTWEADRILSYRIVALSEGNNAVAWTVDGPQFPNFTLAAARMTGTRFDEASLEFDVERDLQVTIRPTKPAVGPGEEVTVEISTVDQLGRPVAAELSLALIDRSLLRLFGDKLPPIDEFFYDQIRTLGFTTGSTNTFDYTPETVPVAEALVEETERADALAANLAERGRVVRDAQDQVQLNMPAPMAVPAAPADPGFGAMGGMGGGMRGGGMMAGRAGMPGMASGEGLEDQSAAFGMGMGMGQQGEALRRRLSESDSKAKSELGLGAARVEFLGKAAAREAGVSIAPRPRERFVETAYWNPSVVTGADGKATVTFVAPTAL